MVREVRRGSFVTEAQLAVFKEFGVPVRYLDEWRKRHLPAICAFCTEPATTAAHHIPFTRGIIQYRLRPDFLNEDWNLIATCSDCNKRAEWADSQIENFVAELQDKT